MFDVLPAPTSRFKVARKSGSSCVVLTQGSRFKVFPAPPSPILRSPSSPLRSAFTLVEILIAIGILSLVIAAIFSSWTAILRGSKVGLESAATVQRARIVIRTLEDSLASVQSFAANQQYYPFIAENGNGASLSFVARLAKSFPRGGKFGDFDVRRLTFSVDGERQLVLRQTPLLMDPDVDDHGPLRDEKEHPLVLAKNVKEFQLEFWDARLNDWMDEWTQTNQLPKLLKVTLKLANNERSTLAQEEIMRIISLPAIAVQPNWQMPALLGGGPGGPPPPGGTQGGQRGGQQIIKP